MVDRALPAQTVTLFPPRAIEITPHDTNRLVGYDGESRGMHIFVGTAGDVRCVPVGNTLAQAVTFKVPGGGYVPVFCSYVLATGTTALAIVGCY